MTGGGRDNRRDRDRGGRRDRGGGGRFRDRRSGGFNDRHGGGGRFDGPGRFDGGNEMYGHGQGYGPGYGGGGGPNFKPPVVLPPGNEDYWEYRDSEDEIAPKADDTFEVEAKRQKLEIDDGLLPGVEGDKGENKENSESGEKKDAPKSLLDLNMEDMVDDYYEYFDGGPNISHRRARQLLDGIDADEHGMDSYGGMQNHGRVYKVIAGEYKFFDGPGPKSTELIKIGQDGRRVSPEEKLFIFVQFLLKNPFTKDTCTAVLEDARNKMNPKQAIKLVYHVVPEEDDVICSMYKCTFYAAGFKIVEVEAPTKIEATELGAEKGLYTLITKTFNEICPSNYHAEFDDGHYETKVKYSREHTRDEGDQEEKDEEPEEKDGHHDRRRDGRRKGPTWRSPKLIIRLQVMKKVLTGTHVSNAYSDMEAAAYTCQVALCIVCYKKTKLSGESDPMRCEMYADEMFLGSGSGNNFQEAQQEVYRSARDNFLRTSVHNMLMNSKRLSELDRDDPNILDIVYRGHYQEIGSNNGSLKTYDIYPADKDKSIDDLVIFEFEANQAKAPFHNLKSSATKSHMLFEWVLSAKDDKSNCRCMVFLQTKLIADVRGSSKINAKKAAAEKIISEYSLTHTIIRCAPVDYSCPTLTYEQLKEQAIQLSGQEEPSEEELAPFLLQAIELVVQQKIEEGTLEPVIFNEDISGDLRKHVKKYAETNNYPLMEKPSDTRKHLILQRKMFTATDMLETLDQSNCVNGKYKLIQKRQGDLLITYFNSDGTEQLHPPEVSRIADVLERQAQAMAEVEANTAEEEEIKTE